MTSPYPDAARPPGGPPSFAKPPATLPAAFPPPTSGPPPAGGVPPGWYPGPSGMPQWWDGQGWGPTAPPGSDNSGTMALFAYLGTFLAGFLVPLVIRQTEGKRNRFVKHHATEALNFTITTGIVSLVLFAVYLVGLLLSVAGAAGTQSVASFGVFFGVVAVIVIAAFALSIISIVFTIIGAVKASQRRYWRYPVAIRFVPGAATKEEVDALNRGVV